MSRYSRWPVSSASSLPRYPSNGCGYEGSQIRPWTDARSMAGDVFRASRGAALAAPVPTLSRHTAGCGARLRHRRVRGRGTFTSPGLPVLRQSDGGLLVLCPLMSEADVAVTATQITGQCPGAAVERTALTVAQLDQMAPLALTWDDETTTTGPHDTPLTLSDVPGIVARLSLPWPGDGPARGVDRREALHGHCPDPHPARRRAGRRTPASPTSTSGDDRNGSGRWPAPSTSPSTRSGSACEWEGLEKIPVDGGALLVANHAGAIPSDAPVIMHGIEKELGRPVYGLADYFFRTVPVVGTLWARGGGVSGPARQRLPAAQGAGAVGPRLPRRHQGSLQVVHRPLPAPAVRPGRLRRDSHARRGADHPDRGDRLRRGHAGHLPHTGRGQGCWDSPTSR